MTLRKAMLILLIAWISQFVKSYRDFEIIFKNITCTFTSKRVRSATCAVGRTPTNIPTISVSVVLTEVVYVEDLDIKVVLTNEQINTNFIDVTLNGCKILENEATTSAMKLVMKTLSDPGVSNVPTKCPLQKNKIYFIKDFYINTENLPPFMPLFKFVTMVHFKEQNVVGAYFEVFGEFKPKNNLKRKAKKSFIHM